jgi:hypothetical protein
MSFALSRHQNGVNGMDHAVAGEDIGFDSSSSAVPLGSSAKALSVGPRQLTI